MEPFAVDNFWATTPKEALCIKGSRGEMPSGNQLGSTPTVHSSGWAISIMHRAHSCRACMFAVVHHRVTHCSTVFALKASRNVASSRKPRRRESLIQTIQQGRLGQDRAMFRLPVWIRRPELCKCDAVWRWPSALASIGIERLFAKFFYNYTTAFKRRISMHSEDYTLRPFSTLKSS